MFFTQAGLEVGAIKNFLNDDETLIQGNSIIKDNPKKRRINFETQLEAVDEFVKSPMLRDDISESLSGIYDIARIVVRISLNTATPPDLISLKKSLLFFMKIHHIKIIPSMLK